MIALLLALVGAAVAQDPPASSDAGDTPPEEAAADEVVAGPDGEAAAEGLLRPLTRRERLQARRRAVWEGPVLPPEADFLQRHTDVRLRIAFNGTAPGPFSLLTAFAGWNELGLVTDTGVTSWRDFTIGLGAGVQAGYGLVLGLTSGRIANYDAYDFGWRMWEANATFRATAHWTRLSAVDPYLFAAVGPGVFHVDAAVRSWPEVDRQGTTSPYVRLEVGGGLMGHLLLAPRWYLGGELRYIVSAQVLPQDRFVYTRGDETAIFTFAPIHRPPKGFSWVVQAGYRF